MSLNIKKVMQDYHVNGRAIASKMNITPAALSQHINGNPSASVLESIAQAIGCEVGEFFETSQRPWVRCPHCQHKIYVDSIDQHEKKLLVDMIDDFNVDDENASAIKLLAED